MEGYDIILLANFYGLNSFNSYFGDVRNPRPAGPVTSRLIVSAGWRSALTNGASIGEVIGKLSVEAQRHQLILRRLVFHRYLPGSIRIQENHWWCTGMLRSGTRDTMTIDLSNSVA